MNLLASSSFSSKFQNGLAEDPCKDRDLVVADNQNAIVLAEASLCRWKHPGDQNHMRCVIGSSVTLGLLNEVIRPIERVLDFVDDSPADLASLRDILKKIRTRVTLSESFDSVVWELLSERDFQFSFRQLSKFIRGLLF